jgi:hypothetical protein
MADWGIFVFRLTFFPAQPSVQVPPAPDLYRRIWTVDPDNYQKSQNAFAPSTAAGKRGLFFAQCTVQAGRVDFNINRLMPEATPDRLSSVQLPLIEDASGLPDEMTEMLSQVERGAMQLPVTRVAYFMQFLSLKSSHAEANKVVLATIPPEFEVKISNEEDFIFQINRPFTSRHVGSLKMNSVVKWSVERIQMLAIVAGPSAGQTLPSPQTVGFIAGSISIDINNNPTTTPLSANQQGAILREAIDVANRIRIENRIRIKGLSEPEESTAAHHVKPN